MACGYEEQWSLASGPDENAIIVGGTWFTRTKAKPDTLVQILSKSDLIGTWHWDWGYYVFNADETGHRLWGVSFDTFTWSIEYNSLTLLFPDDDYEEWMVNAVNKNVIAIGGALFTRGEPLESGIIGYWIWSGGSYVFNPDGSGSRTWDGIFAEFEWEIIDGRLVLSLQGLSLIYNSDDCSGHLRPCGCCRRVKMAAWVPCDNLKHSHSCHSIGGPWGDFRMVFKTEFQAWNITYSI